MTYEPTELAINSPKVLKLNGKLIAIGREVTRRPPAPFKVEVIPEATKTQYRKLYKMGFTKYIKEIDAVVNKSDSENTE